ncbi:glutamine synthetase [Arthrobacter globiformis]|uniref:Glutamine synthetase n=1 Tax=Arthrobacter globiformis TaxID=1665 RepID=A0A328HG47_ARTGO|nr:glutamine synthetase [Arthrobacter globiformis]RAM37507.1 glutamine synthetase [Arthrobacter globiformis]
MTSNPKADLDLQQVRALVISHLDNAGVSRVKVLPGPQVEGAFHHGCGVSVSVGVLLAADDHVTRSSGIDPIVGDLRGIPDRSAVAVIDKASGLAWAPADLVDMQGVPFPTCQRTALKRVAADWSTAGLEVSVGFELEFTVFSGTRDAPVLAHGGPGYSAAAFLQLEAWHLDVLAALLDAGVPVEQIHPEYGRGQVEIALAPRSPVQAVDDYLLARFIVARVSYRHGLCVSYSPMADSKTATNGCHIHFSARNGDGNVFHDAAAATQMSKEGESMIAGVLGRLAESSALLGGSALSLARLQPEQWAGSFICWGTGNREAAVRFVPGLRGDEDGQSNVEVKCCDGSANQYLAVAAILAAAMEGYRNQLKLPAEVTVDPATLSEAERERLDIRPFAADMFMALDDLEGSSFLRSALGHELLDAYVAVRRGEAERFARLDREAVVAALRWRY